MHQKFFIFCLPLFRVAPRIQEEEADPFEVLGPDLAHPAVLEVEKRQAPLVVGSGNLVESHPVGEKACHLEDSVVERHLVGKVEMACHDRQEEVDRLASQKEVEAYQRDHREMVVENRPHQQEVETSGLLDLRLRMRM